MTSHYSYEELLNLGFSSVGSDVIIDRSVRIFGAQNIRIGNRVRIDCFALISAGEAGIRIGNNIHLASGCSLFGTGGRIDLHDFAGISCRSAIYTASDDYKEGFMTGPTVPEEFRNVTTGSVVIGKHAIIGASSVLLPGITLGFGAAVGALTLVRKNVEECEIVFGNPMQALSRKRNGELLRMLELRYAEKLNRVDGTTEAA